MTSSTLKSGVNITEISGKPGQSWGNLVFPGSGKTTMRIDGDTLVTVAKTSFGLETRETYTRIQRIESVDIVQGRLWWLLSLGIPLLFVLFLGIIPIVVFFFYKQKWIHVHSSGGNLILFHTSNQQAKEFCNSLLTIARQLNSKDASATPAPVSVDVSRNNGVSMPQRSTPSA